VEGRMKPCPFCGSKADIVGTEDNESAVMCITCYASGPIRSYDDEAIEAWDRRV